MSTPRDYNQPPWPQGPNPGPDPRRPAGYPQQPGNPWAQAPTQYGPRPGQYGPRPDQYGQPPGQYGRPPGQYGQPPAQYGQPSSPPPSLPKKSKSKNKPFLIIGGIVAALLVVVVLAMVVSGVNQDAKKIAVSDVQAQVQQVLLDRVIGYSSSDIKDVKCNGGQDPTVKKGESFNCTVSVRGKQHQVKVTFKDADGTYSVGLPQLDGGK